MKEYISMLLLISIFSIIISFILPDTKLKKYITVMIGLIIISAVIEPVLTVIKKDNIVETLSMKFNEINYSLNQQINLENSNMYTNEMIRKSAEDKVKEDILNICKGKNVDALSIDINMNNEYILSKVNIYVSDDATYKNIDKLIDEIIDRYDLELNNVNVIKEN